MGGRHPVMSREWRSEIDDDFSTAIGGARVYQQKYFLQQQVCLCKLTIQPIYFSAALRSTSASAPCPLARATSYGVVPLSLIHI